MTRVDDEVRMILFYLLIDDLWNWYDDELMFGANFAKLRIDVASFLWDIDVVVLSLSCRNVILVMNCGVDGCDGVAFGVGNAAIVRGGVCVGGGG